MLRPSPVPVPVGFVVKKGSKILSFTFGGIPGPLSDTRISICESDFEVEGVTNMPAYLERFLAERSAQPGFTYEVVQDDVRGWMVCWKEFTHRGTVRGYGQFYERPYAWLDE